MVTDVNLCCAPVINIALYVKCYMGFPDSSVGKNLPAMQETPIQFLGQEDPPEKGQATHSSILGLPCGSAGKESTLNVGDLGLIPRLGRSPGEGKDYPLQYSGLEKSMDFRVHGYSTMVIAESGTTERLSLSLYVNHTSTSKIKHAKNFCKNTYICSKGFLNASE